MARTKPKQVGVPDAFAPEYGQENWFKHNASVMHRIDQVLSHCTVFFWMGVGVRVRVRVRVCVHVRVRARACACVRARACMHARVCVRARVCVCVCVIS